MSEQPRPRRPAGAGDPAADGAARHGAPAHLAFGRARGWRRRAPCRRAQRAAMRAKVRDVVLLHGWGSCSRRLGRPRAAAGAAFSRACVADLPGYGAAPRAASRTRWRPSSTAVARAAPRRCGVVGWSLGGEVALAWARRAPQQVQRLALIAATPCFTGRPGLAVRDSARGAARIRACADAADRAGTLPRFVAVQARGDARAQQVAGVLQPALQERPGRRGARGGPRRSGERRLAARVAQGAAAGAGNARRARSHRAARGGTAARRGAAQCAVCAAADVRARAVPVATGANREGAAGVLR